MCASLFPTFGDIGYVNFLYFSMLVILLLGLMEIANAMKHRALRDDALTLSRSRSQSPPHQDHA